MERATVADQLLLEAQSQDVKAAIFRIFGDPNEIVSYTHEEQQEYRRNIRHEAFSEARDTIRNWNAGQEPEICLTPKSLEALINEIG